MNKTILLILYIAFIIPVCTFGQVPNLLNPQRAAAAELARKGITEQELLDKLAEKGVSLDNIQNLSANEAIRLQVAIEQAIAEIEAEKRPVSYTHLDVYKRQMNTFPKSPSDIGNSRVGID